MGETRPGVAEALASNIQVAGSGNHVLPGVPVLQCKPPPTWPLATIYRACHEYLPRWMRRFMAIPPWVVTTPDALLVGLLGVHEIPDSGVSGGECQDAFCFIVHVRYVATWLIPGYFLARRWVSGCVLLHRPCAIRCSMVCISRLSESSQARDLV